MYIGVSCASVSLIQSLKIFKMVDEYMVLGDGLDHLNMTCSEFEEFKNSWWTYIY